MEPGPPWSRVVVDIPGIEFEPRPPRGRVIRPDCECDGWSVAGITLRSASLRGDKHRYYRQPRQDAVCSAAHGDTGAVAFAVADGVSSAEASEVGAMEACRAAVYAITRQLDQGAAVLNCQAVACFAADQLRRRAGTLLDTAEPPDEQVTAKLLATTLVAGAAWQQDRQVTAHLFRIGDSSAWILDHALETYVALFGSAPDPSDQVLVSTEVTALPQVPAALEQVTVSVSPGQVLLVGTDGFGLPLGDGDGEIGTLFARQLAYPPSPQWLAHVLDFSRETFDDDRTLLALWALQE